MDMDGNVAAHPASSPVSPTTRPPPRGQKRREPSDGAGPEGTAQVSPVRPIKKEKKDKKDKEMGKKEKKEQKKKKMLRKQKKREQRIKRQLENERAIARVMVLLHMPESALEAEEEKDESGASDDGWVPTLRFNSWSSPEPEDVDLGQPTTPVVTPVVTPVASPPATPATDGAAQGHEQSPAEDIIADTSIIDDMVVDNSVVGDSVPDQSVADDSVAGHSVTVDSLPDESVADDSVAGHSITVDSVAEDSAGEEYVVEDPMTEGFAAAFLASQQPLVTGRAVATGPDAEELPAEEPLTARTNTGRDIGFTEARMTEITAVTEGVLNRHVSEYRQRRRLRSVEFDIIMVLVKEEVEKVLELVETKNRDVKNFARRVGFLEDRLDYLEERYLGDD